MEFRLHLDELRKSNPDAADNIEQAYVDYLTSDVTNNALDLRYAGTDTIALAPGQRVFVSTGLALWINDPTKVGLIFPRSGLGSQGLVLGNLTGVIDHDYQGEMKAMLWNNTQPNSPTDHPDVVVNRGGETFNIEPGDRIAQYMIVNRQPVKATQVDRFSSDTDRGEGGFGHSGVK